MADTAAASVLLLLFATGAAQASTAASAPWLQWSSHPAPDACMGPGLFASKVERSLGRSATGAANDAHVTVVARVERVGGASGTPPRWWGEIQVHGGDGASHGSRSFFSDGPSCEPLADALALATALVLSGDAILTSQATLQPASDQELARPPGKDRGPPAAPVESAPAEVLSRAGPARSWQVGADGAIALGIGLLPEPSLGARVSFFLDLGGGTRIFASGTAWSTQTSSAGGGAGAVLSLASLGLGLCPLHGGWRGWTWRTCARGDLGRLRARGFGFDFSSSQDRPTADAGVAMEVQRRVVGPLFAAVAFELVVPLIRDRIGYSDSSGVVVPVFQPAPVAGVGLFRLACAF